ncbi:tetraacyldisaccharide 4'-kinase [Flagellimonas zhangzhouensis]|uniref:Tetraacyldisaccharide 4'-kinase n=1 Tax=Flagellimonas zhangzhouensis TaxID=1073328 RepID=A0A1H2YWJ7_9FLAO|nr:tetraacyldisaccharide 4'-kinase [Allomuricauda zhangzhouensis]SDR05342.1 lipid-A-disaccharide kinase [Allomuricauda zhangzhouensis]SDX09526.1 lipid-A-disaccharide kinase [Allomuricauda zhangzhouensis]
MLQVLRKIAFPISLIYALVVYVRNFLFDIGVFKSKSFSTPTICVGNISVGGTGKTPMTEFLLRMLKDKKVAVLSRGYKRQSKGFVLANEGSSVLDLGDEPFQIHKKFPDVAIAVDGDRPNGIAQLENGVKPEVIVLDDAMQHRWVKPTKTILLTAYSKLYVNDWYLPTGDLRDAKVASKRADVIVVTKCPASISEAEKKNIAIKLKPESNQKVLFASLAYADFVSDGNQNKPLSELINKSFALVTGIASPEPLVQYLSAMGLEFEHFEFGDHHHFTDEEIGTFSGFDQILTTEKDFVRLEGRVDGVFYLEVAHQFNATDTAALEESLKQIF